MVMRLAQQGHAAQMPLDRKSVWSFLIDHRLHQVRQNGRRYRTDEHMVAEFAVRLA
jgi:hypothetical protein